MQCIGKSRWRPLELCYWPEQGALPAKGKENPGLGYKRLRDDPSPRAQQQQQPAVAHDLGSRFNLSVQTLLSNVFPSTRPTCGLLHWDSYVLVSDRVVLPDGVRPAAGRHADSLACQRDCAVSHSVCILGHAVFNAVYIGSGRIHHIMEDTSVSGPKVLRFKSAVISPGIETGTRAAVVGGVTTVVDMPLNSFPVKANANIAYWAGLVPANAANHTVLQALLDGGARGFKAFMSPSGINDFANVDAPDIAAALPFLKQAGVPLFVHAERVEAGPDTVEHRRLANCHGHRRQASNSSSSSSSRAVAAAGQQQQQQGSGSSRAAPAAGQQQQQGGSSSGRAAASGRQQQRQGSSSSSIRAAAAAPGQQQQQPGSSSSRAAAAAGQQQQQPGSSSSSSRAAAAAGQQQQAVAATAAGKRQQQQQQQQQGGSSSSSRAAAAAGQQQQPGSSSSSSNISSNISSSRAAATLAAAAGQPQLQGSSSSRRATTVSTRRQQQQGFACSLPEEALEAERPDVLELLRTRLLPVLVGLLANLFAWRSISQGDPRLYQTYLDSRPPAMEQAAIQMLIKLLDEDKASAAPGFVDAQARHPISVETVPHYLHFNSEAIAAGQTQFKCAPPIRDAHNKVALRRALASGAINLVSSDHSPAPPAMKHTESGLFTEAWGGIAGLQYLVPATWTALSQTGAGLERLTAVLSEEPAKLAGFAGRKGQLAPGFDADIMVWEPESPADTSIAANQHKHKLTPYTDLPLLGKVVGTIVQGHFVFMSGRWSDYNATNYCKLDCLLVFILGLIESVQAVKGRMAVKAWLPITTKRQSSDSSRRVMTKKKRKGTAQQKKGPPTKPKGSSGNSDILTVYNQLQRRRPMLMPVFEDPSSQALLTKLQELGNINLRSDANTIGVHSMQLAVSMQQHYSNPGK
ncbi:hypothetical protein QJQ45_019804 [Haematococcus lacustris]|nr:hypothetical protein QJQ45_019804 [Haematococcus lacustris]